MKCVENEIEKGKETKKKKLERLTNREKNGKNQIRVSIITETMGYTFILIHSKRKEKKRQTERETRRNYSQIKIIRGRR